MPGQPPRALLFALQVLGTSLLAWSLRRKVSVAATAYAGVIVSELLLCPELPSRTVYCVCLLLSEVLVKIVCSLFATSAWVLFNQEDLGV